MPSITSSGLGSGIDINSIVASIVAAERAPREGALTREKVASQSQLSAFGSLRSSLEAFNASLAGLEDLNDFQKRAATTNGDNYFTLATDNTAAPGKYSVQVVSLATHHKIASNAFDDNETSIGEGTLDFTVNGETFSLTIDAADGGDTVEGIRDAINSAEDNVGITATIVQDDDGSHLVLSSSKTGVENEITVVATNGASGNLKAALEYSPVDVIWSTDPEVPHTNPVTNGMNPQTQPLDSEVKVDGFTKTSSNFKIEGVIQGVVINLQDIDPDEGYYDINVKLDKSATKSAISKFVTSYNALVGNMNALTSYDAETKQSGLLQGDSTINFISSRLRIGLSEVVGGAVNNNLDTLAELGITTDYETGQLEIDDTALDTYLDDDFDDIGSLFAGDEGIAKKLLDIIDPYTKSGGTLDIRKEGLESGIERLNDQYEALNKRMESVEARYQAQFLAMDALVAQLSSSGDFLASALEGVSAIINYKK